MNIVIFFSVLSTNLRKNQKNDYRDAITIAKCLASSAYKAVYLPDEKDEDVRDFIRMRDDHKTALK